MNPKMMELAEALANKAHTTAADHKKLFPPRINTLTDQPVKSAEEYETRLAALMAAIEGMGYEVVRQVIPAHMADNDGFVMQELHTERVVVNDGATNIKVLTVRHGVDVGGLRAAELWLTELRQEHQDKLADEARVEGDRQRAEEAVAEAYANRAVTRQEFSELQADVKAIRAMLEEFKTDIKG